MEIDKITKDLSNIIVSLNNLLAKNNQAPALIQPETRIKKTSDMTYHDFLVKVLAPLPPV